MRILPQLMLLGMAILVLVGILHALNTATGMTGFSERYSCDLCKKYTFRLYPFQSKYLVCNECWRGLANEKLR